MSTKLIALFAILLLACSCLKVSTHHQPGKGRGRGPPSSQSWESDSWESESEFEECASAEEDNALFEQFQDKFINFMVNDDEIRAVLIDQISSENPDMSWLADLESDVQIQVLTIMMAHQDDPEAMITALSAIPEVSTHIEAMMGVDAEAAPAHLLKVRMSIKH